MSTAGSTHYITRCATCRFTRVDSTTSQPYSHSRNLRLKLSTKGTLMSLSVKKANNLFGTFMCPTTGRLYEKPKIARYNTKTPCAMMEGSSPPPDVVTAVNGSNGLKSQSTPSSPVRLSSRIQQGFVSATGSIRASRKMMLDDLGSLKKSRFADWNREEMIDFLIALEYEIRHEQNENVVTDLSLRDLCDELCFGMDMPEKPEPMDLRTKKKIDKGIRLFQNMWIEHQHGIRQHQERNLHAADFDDEHSNFNFDPDALDIGDLDDVYDDHVDNRFTENRESITNLREQDQGHHPKQNRRRRHSPHNDASTKSILDTPWVYPDWDQAKVYLDLCHARKGDDMKKLKPFDLLTTTTGRHCVLGGAGEQCDMWNEGQVSELSKYGPGITNYFKFLKWSGWMCLCLFVISLPLLLLNIESGTNNTSGTLTSITATTVGNLAQLGSGSNNTTASLRVPGCNSAIFGSTYCTIDRESLGLFYMGVDVLASVLVIVACVWLFTFERNEEVALDANAWTTADYAIQVKHLPPNCNEEDIRQHFHKLLNEKFVISPIVSVNIAFANAKEIAKCDERGKLIREKTRLIHEHRYECTRLRREAQQSNDPGAEATAQQRIQSLRKKLREEFVSVDERLNQFASSLTELSRTSQQQPLAAFVTFNDEIGAAIAHDLYSSPRDLCCSHPGLLMDGRMIRVMRAPEPRLVIWENLEVRRLQRIGRRLLTTTATSLLIAISLAAAFGATALHLHAQAVGGNGSCPQGFSAETASDQDRAVSLAPSILHCYCDDLPLVKRRADRKCRDYAQAQLSAQVMTFFAAIIVSLVNSWIERALRMLVPFEKHHSQDTRERSLFVRLFALRYLNIAFVFLFNTNSTILTNVFQVPPAQTIDSDYSSNWYQSTGVMIVLVLVADIFFNQSRPLRVCFSKYLRLRRARLNAKMALTQADLNRLHVGPTFELPFRYAQVTSTLAVCLTFSTGIPILYFITFVNLCLFYFSEKFLFVRVYRAPPRMGSQIGRLAGATLPIALVLHLVMSIWIMSDATYFSMSESVLPLKTSVVNLVQQKISYAQTLPQFILLVLVVAACVLDVILAIMRKAGSALSTWMWADQETKIQIKEELEAVVRRRKLWSIPFLRACKRNVVKGLTSYNILQNPEYKERFAISWKFANQHKHMKSVRLSLLPLSPSMAAAARAAQEAHPTQTDSDQVSHHAHGHSHHRHAHGHEHGHGHGHEIRPSAREAEHESHPNGSQHGAPHHGGSHSHHASHRTHHRGHKAAGENDDDTDATSPSDGSTPNRNSPSTLSVRRHSSAASGSVSAVRPSLGQQFFELQKQRRYSGVPTGDPEDAAAYGHARPRTENRAALEAASAAMRPPTQPPSRDPPQPQPQLHSEGSSRPQRAALESPQTARSHRPLFSNAGV